MVSNTVRKYLYHFHPHGGVDAERRDAILEGLCFTHRLHRLLKLMGGLSTNHPYIPGDFGFHLFGFNLSTNRGRPETKGVSREGG